MCRDVTSVLLNGLRDYGCAGQIGLEETPELYVSKLVKVFSEVKRILKKDGTLFLNLGDSYFGSGKGGNPEGSKWSGFVGNKKREESAMPSLNVQRAKPCGTSDKEPVNYLNHDYSFENLCGVCQQASRHKSHTHDQLSPMLIASLFSPNHENMEFLIDRFPTLDFSHQVNHILISISDFLHSQYLSTEHLLSFYKSMPSEFYQQLLALCLQRGNSSSCFLCGRSLTYNVPQSFHKSFDELMQYWHNQDIALPFVQQDYHNQYIDMVSEYYNEILSYFKLDIQPQCTINNRAMLKPKDLIGIPWMVAFALRADGWYLRQDIIWHKPNPMPESVTDRCTKAHEYIFLLSKSGKYYFDAEAIQEIATGYDGRKDTMFKGGVKYKGFNQQTMLSRGHERWKYKNLQSDGQQPNTMHIKRTEGKTDENYPIRNKRSVWTVNTMPYSEAHFATFPEKLIVDMIKAGCPEGGIVLDTFMGAGTTAIVARKLERNYIGFELNPEYIKITERRIRKELGMFV